MEHYEMDVGIWGFDFQSSSLMTPLSVLNNRWVGRDEYDYKL